MADAEPTPPTDDPTAPVPAAPVPPAPRKRRRWLRAVLLLLAVAVVGLLLLLAVAPTLLSTRPAVNLALAQVNKRLNGHVEAGTVSLGWTTGIKIDGLRVFDEAGAQIAQVEHLTCPMPLYKAATGHYPLGHTVIDGLDFDARYDAQGRLNFSRLAKTAPATPPAPAQPAPAQPAAPAPPSKLPDVSGDVEITNARGTVSRPGKPTVSLTSLAAKVSIPDINGTIADHVAAAVQVAGGPPGTLTVDGTAAAVRNRVLALDTAAIHQQADVTGLDLAAAKQFAPAGVDTLAGQVVVHFLFDVANGKSATLDASLTGQKVALGGAVLKGDTFATDTLTAAVPKLTAAFPDGLGHWQSGRITVGTAGGPPVALKVDQGTLTLAADVVPQSVLNLAAGHAPASAGTVALNADFDLAKLATDLRHTAGLADNVQLSGGAFKQTLTVTLTPDRGTVAAATDLTNIAGTRDGKPVAVKPVHLAVGAAEVGGANPLDGLRDLSLQLTSSFANATFKGTDVGNLDGSLTASLQQLQAEGSQFHDFGTTHLSGEVAVHVTNKGQLTAAPYAAAVKADASITNLVYADAAGPRVSQPLVRVDLSGDLHGSEHAAVERVEQFLLTLKAGATAASPTLDLAVTVPTATLGAAKSADATVKLHADLPQGQREFANVPRGQLGNVIASGVLNGTIAVHYAADTLRIDPSTLSVDNLVVQRQLPTGQRLAAVNDDTITVALAGTVATAADVRTVTLSQLSVADSAHILDLHKGDGELSVAQGKTTLSGRGTLDVMAQLASLTQIQQVLGRTAATDPAPAGKLQSGRFAGTLAFQQEAGKTTLTGDFAIPDLNVVTPTAATGPQKVTIVLRANSGGGTLTVAEASLKSPFATAALTDVAVNLAAKSTVNKLTGAKLAVDVPDLKSVGALLAAFSAPPPPAKPGETATPPLVFTAGTLAVRGDVSRDGDNLVLSVPNIAAVHVAFTRGTAHYTAKPILAKVAARVGTVEGDKLSIAQQLAHLSVTQLDADAGVATVSLTEPITVADLTHPGSATGAIKVDGDLAGVCQLAAAYGAKPADAYPYRGHLTAVQKIAGGADTLAVVGTATVDNFQVAPTGQTATPADQLAVVDDVALPADFSAVTLKTVSLDLRTSGALHLAINNGTVTDLKGRRNLNLPVELRYDLAQLWLIVHPMLAEPGQPDAYADVKVSGQYSRPANVTGSYPADVPFAQAIRPVKADFGLAVASFEHSGITVTKLDVPCILRDGHLTTTDPNGNVPLPATANGGQLTLGHLTVDLTQTPYRLSAPANTPLLANVSINPLFTRGILGKVVNNPVFVGAEQATGLISLAFDSCDRLPLGDLLKQQTAANDGSAHLRFSMTKVHIGVPSLSQFSSALNNDSFETHVDNATVAVAHGVEQQRIAFVSGPYTFDFNGTVRLADDAFAPMTVTVPLDTILSKQSGNANLRKYLPDTVPIVLKGQATAPQPQVDQILGQLLQQAGQKAVQNGAGDLVNQQLNKALGGNKGTTAGKNDDPLGGLINGALGGKKKR